MREDEPSRISSKGEEDHLRGEEEVTDTQVNKRRRLSRTEQKRLSKQRKKQKCPMESPLKKAPASSTQPHEAYLSQYVPLPALDTPSPLLSSQAIGKSQKKSENAAVGIPKVSSVGKWFPNAVQLKRPLSCIQERPSDKKQAALLLFYQYVTPWNETEYRRVHDYLLQIGLHRVNVAGRIRLSKEGLNVTLSAVDYVPQDYKENECEKSNYADDGADINYDLYCANAVTSLHYFVQDLIRFDAALFSQTDFKYIPQLTPDRHFTSFQIIPVQELVYYGGLNDQNASIVQNGGKHVSPADFHRLLAGADLPKEAIPSPKCTEELTTDATKPKKDIVVIDVRNHYEAVIGRFDGQEETSGDAGIAKYVDPKMRKSTDFPKWVQNNVDDLMQKDRILLYCTGGIRCERASAHLTSVLMSKKQENNALPEIYQLQGGIEKYLQTYPEGGFWRGKNFTFDKREAISADNWNGDGGVLQKHKTAAVPKDAEEKSSTLVPECVVCHVSWDRYLGKKKCCTCGVPILVCDTCLSTPASRESLLKAQCSLCVEEDITVPASALAYTQNGIQAKVLLATDAKAASTVLKWGGGHGQSKQQPRSCKYGARCRRADCIFPHPEK